MSTCRIHNVRFYNLEPKSITCLCYEQKTKKLALSRNDNSIEIWNVENAPFVERTIVGHPEGSVEAVLWVDLRLFSTGLHGMVMEHDLTSLGVKYETVVTGGAAWCMDVNKEKTRLAIGTEDGYVNTFTVTSDSLLYERIFDKQGGRILCIKWDNTGEMIFSGSINTVRVWNSVSGHAIHRMTTVRKEAKKGTIIWCLGVTSDNFIVSGDSCGVLSFWDPNMGTLMESHESHTADILALSVSQDTDVVYCAGVDPVVRSFSKIILKSSGRAQWVKGIERRLHVHDVRALIEADGKLYSAGVDGYLAQSSYPPKMLVKYPPLLQPPCVTVCKKTRCILLRYTNYLEIWRLGKANTSSQNKIQVGMTHPLEEEPIKLLELKTKGNESIVSCAINKDSKTIVYSTNSHVRIFHFDVVDGDAQLSRSEPEIPLKRIQKMLFSPDGKLFLAIVNEGDGNSMFFFKVKQKCLSHEGTINIDKDSLNAVSLVCFSPNSKYLICTDHHSHIVIYTIDSDLSSGSLKSWKLPKYRYPPTAMAVQADTLNLVVVYSDHKIIEYNISKRMYTQFSNNLEGHLPKQWLTRPFPITNVTFDPNNENVIIVHDDTTVYVINKNKELPESESKIPRLENGDSVEGNNSGLGSQSQHAFHVAKKYKHLVHLDWLNDTEMVAVEVNPISLTEKLPPTLKQKSFGI
ncbi:U3 small nucleolar RNA-associated protein 4 homolog [Cephus cinctus]|uniref:U3 small nucleolar RNA-associated protein 4 homolog n=1 Tax=Cephus cinctus TaxID=211228 RepID=A0AAJ7FEN4_CEPCN|nr:U3 small nucleolar RNA-associated protein 4 homolog [Cephus cinctus]